MRDIVQVSFVWSQAKKNVSPKGSYPGHRSADFDGDGREDKAAILLNDRSGRFDVFARRASVGRYVVLTRGDRISSLWNYTLDLVEPGVPEPACARCADGAGACRKTVENRWPAVGLIAVEASMSMTYWNGRRFETEFLTD